MCLISFISVFAWSCYTSIVTKLATYAVCIFISFKAALLKQSFLLQFAKNYIESELSIEEPYSDDVHKDQPVWVLIFKIIEFADECCFQYRKEVDWEWPGEGGHGHGASPPLQLGAAGTK